MLQKRGGASVDDFRRSTRVQTTQREIALFSTNTLQF
jgi:hypothetical protein